MPVYVIDTLKPKNGLDFPVVEAIDVAVEGYSSLADAVSHFVTDAAIATITAALDGKADKRDKGIAYGRCSDGSNKAQIKRRIRC